MPSQKLLDELNHLGEVNRLLDAAGAVGKLSDAELRLQALAVQASVSPLDFANHILTDRRALQLLNDGRAA